MRDTTVVRWTSVMAATVMIATGIMAGDPTAPVPLAELSTADRDARIDGDMAAVKVYRDGLMDTAGYALAQTNLFPVAKLKEKRLLRREQREAIWSTWKRFLDYELALDAVGQYHGDFHRLRKPARERSFIARYAAFLAQYRCALDWIERVENDPDLDTVLNEPVPELGLPAGSYARLKYRFLHVGRASEFAAFDAVLKWYGDDRAGALAAGMEADRKRIWAAGKGTGQALTAKNGLKIVTSKGFEAYFPVQAGVSAWMGDARVWRKNRSLIAPDQVAAMLPKLEPGDILLERREWFVSNIGLPGYWPHAALYIGTPEERRKYFGDDALETRLREQYPAAYAQHLKPQEHNHASRVLEAISEGVTFTSLEHSADADAVVVLRPRLPQPEKAEAIRRAFHYAGRPYDFNFDFRTDAALVCTELVYKAYEPSNGGTGLTFQTEEMLGRPVMPANSIARMFDAQFGSEKQQLDFVMFLDGHERAERAAEADVAAFRASWQRPKWHIVKTALSDAKD